MALAYDRRVLVHGFLPLMIKSDASMIPAKRVRILQWSPPFGSFQKRIPKSLPLITPSLIDTFVAYGPYNMDPYGGRMIP